MIYAVANLHGCYDEFQRLLKKIQFTDDDVMFVLGDIVDFGAQSMELVCDLSMRYNVYCVMGEHDKRAAELLGEFYDILKNGKTPDADYVERMKEWISDGGDTTLEEFRKLDDDMKEGVIDYLSELAPYETVECGGKEYVLVHAGIADFDPDKDLDDYDEEAFYTEPIEMDKEYFKDAILVTGHVSTFDIDGATEGKIYKKGNNIAIDCAIAFDGSLACLCLNDGKEIYVQ